MIDCGYYLGAAIMRAAATNWSYTVRTSIVIDASMINHAAFKVFGII